MASHSSPRVVTCIILISTFPLQTNENRHNLVIDDTTRHDRTALGFGLWSKWRNAVLAVETHQIPHPPQRARSVLELSSLFGPHAIIHNTLTLAFTLLGFRGFLLGPALSLALESNIISTTDVSPLTLVLASDQGSQPLHGIRRFSPTALSHRWLSEWGKEENI